VLINVAGYFPIQSYDEMTAADFRKVVDINLTGTFLMTEAVTPLLRGRGWGRIVTMGSASVFGGVADQVHYVAAKAGIFGLSRSLARVLGRDGITVNVVTPDLTVTPAVKAKMPAEIIEPDQAPRVPARRAGRRPHRCGLLSRLARRRLHHRPDRQCRRRKAHAVSNKEAPMPDLFDGYDLHGLALPNRVAMSAMTRTRATEIGVPTALMRDYYVQRASAGLIVTECTQVSDQGHGIIRCPGIHRDDQVAGWRELTDAVHAAGGRIYSQIWHCGRVGHPDMRGGELPVGPSP